MELCSHSDIQTVLKSLRSLTQREVRLSESRRVECRCPGESWAKWSFQGSKKNTYCLSPHGYKWVTSGLEKLSKRDKSFWELRRENLQDKSYTGLEEIKVYRGRAASTNIISYLSLKFNFFIFSNILWFCDVFIPPDLILFPHTKWRWTTSQLLIASNPKLKHEPLKELSQNKFIKTISGRNLTWTLTCPIPWHGGEWIYDHYYQTKTSKYILLIAFLLKILGFCHFRIIICREVDSAPWSDSGRKRRHVVHLQFHFSSSSTWTNVHRLDVYSESDTEKEP